MLAKADVPMHPDAAWNGIEECRDKGAEFRLHIFRCEIRPQQPDPAVNVEADSAR